MPVSKSDFFRNLGERYHLTNRTKCKISIRSFPPKLKFFLKDSQPTWAVKLNLEEKDVLAAINSYSPEGVPKTKKAKSTAVKRPKSAFLFFGDEMRLTIKAEGNDLKIGEVSKELGKRWKEVSAEEKKRFVDMAAEAKSGSSSSENKKENLLKSTAAKRTKCAFLFFWRRNASYYQGRGQ